MNTRTTRDITTTDEAFAAGTQRTYAWTAPNGVNVSVQTFRSNKYLGPEDEGFRPSAISVNGSEKWKRDTSGMCLTVDLVWIEDDQCPIVINANTKQLFTVLPTQDFEVAQVALVGGVSKLLGGSTIEQLLDLKLSLAEGLKLKPSFTVVEQTMMTERQEVARRERAARKAAEASQEDTSRADRMKARMAFRDELLKRQPQIAYTATGEVRRGAPVTEKEIQRLTGDRHYIVMNDAGEPVRYFFLTEAKQQRCLTEVSSMMPEAKVVAVVAAPEAEDIILVKHEGAAVEAPLYRDATVLSHARMSWTKPVVAAHHELVRGNRTGRICVVLASNKECLGVGVVIPPKQPMAA